MEFQHLQQLSRPLEFCITTKSRQDFGQDDVADQDPHTFVVQERLAREHPQLPFKFWDALNRPGA